eukprot:TRINITY_DN10587_c0_g1_i1.p1 TRINITY_DN10587_c0_g1~~TRINITY_DN10587_c0_g1_i1.p1  ORF type:complete len:324 (+),score=63.97 TRINITY_DN10587_c0_g1_i1:67-1038(+)
MKDWMRVMLRGIGEWGEHSELLNIEVGDIVLPTPALKVKDIRNGASQDVHAWKLFRRLEEATYQNDAACAAQLYIELANRFAEIGHTVVERQYYSCLHSVTLGQVYAESSLTIAVRDYGSQHPDVIMALAAFIMRILKISKNGYEDEELQKCGLALLIQQYNKNRDGRESMLFRIKTFIEACAVRNSSCDKVASLLKKSNVTVLTRSLIMWMGYPSKARTLRRKQQLADLPVVEADLRDGLVEEELLNFQHLVSQFHLRIAVNAVVHRHAIRNCEAASGPKVASLLEKESISRLILTTAESKELRNLTMTNAALGLLTRQKKE